MLKFGYQYTDFGNEYYGEHYVRVYCFYITITLFCYSFTFDIFKFSCLI